MSRKGPRKNNRKKNNNRTRQSQSSIPSAPSPDKTSTLDPDKYTIPELCKRIPVRIWGYLIGLAFAVFSLGAWFGQTDLAMDYLGNRTRLNLETERASHSETKRELGITKNSLAKAQTEADQLQQELVDTRKKHEILELFLTSDRILQSLL